MSKFDPAEFGRYVGRRTKEMIAAALVPVLEQLKSLPALSEQVIRLDERLKSLPQPKDGKDGRDGTDGKDGTTVSPEEVKALIDVAVKSIPMPKDGKDGTDGKDGKSVAVADLQPVVDAAIKEVRESAAKSVSDALAAIRPEPGQAGKDGTDGKDGRTPTPEEIKAVVDAAMAPMLEQAQARITKAIESIPVPKDGRDGKDGEHGKDGTSVSVDDIKPMVTEFLKSIPVPKDGRDGKDITVDEVVAKLLPAIAERHEVATKSLALDFERKMLDTVREAIKMLPQPKDGKDGRDGTDGLPFDSLEIRQSDDLRTATLVGIRNGVVKELGTMQLAGFHYQGIYDDQAKYLRGDSTTFGGSLFLATKDAPTGKPGEPGCDGWKLATKRGRDGKDGRDGIDMTKPVDLK